MHLMGQSDGSPAGQCWGGGGSVISILNQYYKVFRFRISNKILPMFAVNAKNYYNQVTIIKTK